MIRLRMKKILVVGGAGYIGSHVNKLLAQEGYDTVVFDSLSRGSPSNVVKGLFVKGDLSNPNDLHALFDQHTFDAVMHFAAYIDVGESVSHPELYYQNNVSNTLNLLHIMVKKGVSNLIFSSSAAVYGIPNTIPIQEDHPFHPINPYGRTKLMVEQILGDYEKAYGLHSCSLRYFNAAGGDPEGLIKNYNLKENNLIPIILKNIKSSKPVTIFGTDYPTPDGTCVRDYIHVQDLAEAHILAMKHLMKNGGVKAYNLGNGNGFSVREVLKSAEKVTGLTVQVQEGQRRPGDPAILLADASKAAAELGWKPQYPQLDRMIGDAWRAISY